MSEGSKGFDGFSGLSGTRVRQATATQHRNFFVVNNKNRSAVGLKDDLLLRLYQIIRNIRRIWFELPVIDA
jgi:hypothetical protein